ncbi:hypothetical protein VN97_g11013 [Penicillium thymicola]|uniref:Uncharacterized protein n=1 Tax=Penicillium thymicola TaxID=293382 RepID=A0AAI9X3R6_PENTH|nr:hypothetical protein VN97_g11013 [Penicillium thymicola]
MDSEYAAAIVDAWFRPTLCDQSLPVNFQLIQGLLQRTRGVIVNPSPDIASSVFWINGLVQKSSPDRVLGGCELDSISRRVV